MKRNRKRQRRRVGACPVNRCAGCIRTAGGVGGVAGGAGTFPSPSHLSHECSGGEVGSGGVDVSTAARRAVCAVGMPEMVCAGGRFERDAEWKRKARG